jgi:metal-dependent amidase/aminoacylase/carboxypeptidase family protein
VTINTDQESAFVHGVAAGELGAAALASNPPVMASDDMSLFLKMRPGCYFRVGISPTDGRPHPHHAPEFEMNEDGLPVGLRLGLAVMLNALGA